MMVWFYILGLWSVFLGNFGFVWEEYGLNFENVEENCVDDDFCWYVGIGVIYFWWRDLDEFIIVGFCLEICLF